MNVLRGQVVFSVGSEQYRWDDVILSARLRGEWDDLEKQLRDGLACLKRLDEEEEEIDPDELQAAANDFRYERDLVSAEEAEAWLDRRHLGVEEWMEYIQRALLRQKWAEQLAEISERFPVTTEEIRSHLRAEAICSGHLARFARALAERASAHARALESGWIEHQGQSAEAVRRIRMLEASYRCFCDHVVDPRGLKNQVDSHRLDWIRFDCRYVVFAQEQMAREAALCARDDGTPLDEIAASGGFALQGAVLYLDDIEPSLRDRFLAAERGALIGPLDWDNAYGIFSIMDKVMPTLDDPEIKRRARAALLEVAINREISNRVTWHARL
jgi:hypothetical protein